MQNPSQCFSKTFCHIKHPLWKFHPFSMVYTVDLCFAVEFRDKLLFLLNYIKDILKTVWPFNHKFSKSNPFKVYICLAVYVLLHKISLHFFLLKIDMHPSSALKALTSLKN